QTVIRTFADNGDYTVTLIVSDPYGGTTSQTQTLSVDNTAPTITSLAVASEVNEGEPLTFRGTLPSTIRRPSLP
ncbi:MAG: PKD domain-containing protein, partial [Phormidesmis sp.]